ncbi:unnamed protein product [Calicophoron daubneyi]|uniref:Uncharacterized protein n=1 Tax=Calicophoron daubneyi TaxID=300641 RepID=A0AAV2T6Q8_CALDB
MMLADHSEARTVERFSKWEQHLIPVFLLQNTFGVSMNFRIENLLRSEEHFTIRDQLSPQSLTEDEHCSDVLLTQGKETLVKINSKQETDDRSQSPSSSSPMNSDASHSFNSEALITSPRSSPSSPHSSTADVSSTGGASNSFSVYRDRTSRVSPSHTDSPEIQDRSTGW